MLKVQEYLKSGKTFDDLHAGFDLKVVRDKNLPLVILDYDQIKSPKLEPIVQECRGLMLHTETFEIVSRCFGRFFELGEMVHLMKDFNWNNCTARDKEDGSLFRLYHFYNKWRVGTRASFGDHTVDSTGITWEELFLEATGLQSLDIFDGLLDRKNSYVFELVSLHNKVVRVYGTPKAFLLTTFQGEDELPDEESSKVAKLIGVERPTFYVFRSEAEVRAHNRTMSEKDPTYEGVVIYDGNRRWKVHTETYRALHHMMGIDKDDLDGNPYHPKRLLPFILMGREDVPISKYPSIKDYVLKIKMKVDTAYAELEKLWSETYSIEDQKEFARAVGPKTKFPGLLFTLRREKGTDQTLDDLRNIWRDSGSYILRVLF